MKKDFLWKLWLRPNFLTKDVDNDFIAEVSTVGNTKRNEDIASKIVEEGSEIKYDTLLSILRQRDRIVRRMLQEGNSVLTGCENLSPRVSGIWLGSSAKFDPAVHKIRVDMKPSYELRKALEEIGVEMLGVKENAGYIGLVTDTATGLTDGTITPEDDILIEGEKLRIAPDGEAGLGVVFIDDMGNQTFVTRRMTQNDPKKVLARVPALSQGEYTLRIVTRFSTSSFLLNEPRIIEYHKKLIIQ